MADFFEPPYDGTPNPDEMFGTPDGEVFHGKGGADNIFGEDGSDKIYGGDDGDWIEGGSGNDRIWGEDGNDQMWGDAGDDSMIGGRGNDNMEGGTGNDCMQGKQGRDYMDGGDGDDCMEGNSGRDTMFGGSGNDTMHGQGSKDFMDGGAGNDAMSGGKRDDTMEGGTGTDCMKGDEGKDLMWGDVAANGADGPGNDDIMLGGDGADTLYGQGGNDKLDGGDGQDVIDGGRGDDLIAGGGGDDILTGGSGSDTFLFRQNEVQGNTDTDVITDWDPNDPNEKIALCGQIDPFYTVEKIEIGFFDNFANNDADVRIGLSTGQFILLLDVGDSGDWVADHDRENGTPEENNAGNFVRPTKQECEINCDIPECDKDDGDRPQLGSIGDFVWNDVDGDGIQDPGEQGITGVTVELQDGAMNPIDSTVTNSNGFYSFGGLQAGSYHVRFVLPNGFTFSPQDQGGDDAKDSDADPATGKTALITLAEGEDNDTIDAGLVERAIGDRVWEDLNGNGIQDPGEQGIAGATVELQDSAMVALDTTTTDANGHYWFTDLDPGNYHVRFVLPAGFLFTAQNVGGDDAIDSDADPTTGKTGLISLDPGEVDPTNDAGMYRPGSIGDFVWEDTDADGIQDAGEQGIAGAEVKLLADTDNDGQIDDVVATTNTDGTGFYEFTGLTPGVEYKVMFNNPDAVGPDAYHFSPRQAGADPAVDSDGPMSDVIVLSSGETDDTIDTGLYRNGSIHVFGFLDEDGDGVRDSNEGAFPDDPGKTIELLDDSGQVIATSTTVEGEVWFENLTPGTYTVRENPVPDGFAATTPLSATVTVNSGEEIVYADGAAMLPAGDQRTEVNVGSTLLFGNTELGSIGDFVWEDADADGIQDAGEQGIAGATVKLLADSDNDGQIDDVVATTNTDGTGFYEFTGLMPGVEYKVMFNNPDAVGPDAYNFSPRQAGADPAVDSDGPMSDVIVLSSGETDDTIDAGLYRNGSIHVFGFLDEDADGFFDENEEAFPDDPGKTIELLDEAGNVVDTSTTVEGEVWFENLTPGTYTVRENPVPAGFTPTTPVEVTVTVQSGQELVYADGAAMLPPGDQRTEVLDDRLYFGNGVLASIGDFVWDDLDADGIQDAGESGIAGATVELQDAGMNAIASTVTDANGLYQFTGLQAGTYFVRFLTPAGFQFSPQDVGPDDTVDSDANPATGKTAAITVALGENNDTIDAGMYRLASIGDFVWNDSNGDGIQDAGEPGVGGVTVELQDSGMNVIASTTTSGAGFYGFAGLTPGDYHVRFVLPSGFEFSPPNQGADDAVDSDADPGTGKTGVINLVSGENDSTVDAGLTPLASIGDRVWNDQDGDGIQDAGEPGIVGATVNLLNGSNVQVDTTVTGGNGIYSFDNLVPGDYRVEFVKPGGFDVASPFQQGGDPTVDSDANPADSLRSDVVTLSPGEDNDTIDAGFVLPPTQFEVFNIVYVIDATGSTDNAWVFNGANPWTGFDGTVYADEQNPNPTNPINDPNPPEGLPSPGDVIDAEIAAYKNLTESLLDEIASAETANPLLDIQVNVQVIKFWNDPMSISIGQFNPEIAASKDALFAELENTGSNNETNYGPPLRDAVAFFDLGLGTEIDPNPTDVMYFLGDNDLKELTNNPTVQSQVNQMSPTVFREAWLVPNDIGDSDVANDSFRDIDSDGLPGVETLETVADLQFDYINDVDVL